MFQQRARTRRAAPGRAGLRRPVIAAAGGIALAAAVAACGAPGGGSPTAAAPTPVSTNVTSTPVTLSASSARPVRSLTGVQAGAPKTDCQLFGACAGRALFLAGFPPRPGLSARLGQRDAAR